jgi:hypothetical protein
MKAEILIKTNHLLYRYTHILNEVIAQKDLYANEQAFIQAWGKYAGIVNRLQGSVLKYAL